MATAPPISVTMSTASTPWPAPRRARNSRRCAEATAGVSPHLGRNRRDPFSEGGDFVPRVGKMDALRRGGTLGEREARPPFAARPDWTRREVPAAIRADVSQMLLDAVRAERAFIGADAGLHRGGRQVLV